MKSQRHFLFLLLICFVPVAYAESESHEIPMDSDFLVHVAPVAAGHGGDQKFFFISADMEHGGKLIKGAPYSAEAVTERTQTLSDGNRIVNKSSSMIYRDREGRTRREQQIRSIGNWEATEEPPAIVFIQDPVAKVHYVLEPENKVARKMKVDSDLQDKVPGDGKKFEKVVRHSPHPMPHSGEFGGEMIRYKFDEKNAKEESLGKQTIEGLVVEGTRSTITIPAGQMGNELPIQIISERWYSPDLQVNVLTRHSDPRFGETVYQLTRIARGEQDRALFEVPKDYKVEEGGFRHKIVKREKTQ